MAIRAAKWVKGDRTPIIFRPPIAVSVKIQGVYRANADEIKTKFNERSVWISMLKDEGVGLFPFASGGTRMTRIASRTQLAADLLVVVKKIRLIRVRAAIRLIRVPSRASGAIAHR